MTDFKPKNDEEGVPGDQARQLCPDGILVAEFEYIAQTAFQANEDRARVSTFSVVTVGTLVVAVLGTQFESFPVPYGYWAFTVLFLGLTVNSSLTLLELVRLRQAWFESILAMNQIKSFFITRFHDAKLEDAFRWSNQSAPPRFKTWSVSFLLAIQVSFLGGITLGAAIVFAGLGFGSWWWIRAIVLGFAVFFCQLILYWRLIRVPTR